mmetsp:Transcript_141550/g.394496  ORF Transcript_141550/g.394496 Transcript_141550/m.394496 type:complete len:351 (-) Transcript_141550:402-1454(-)
MPVTTLSTAKTVKKMNTQNSHIRTQEISARGIAASCQLTPPEIDLNNVIMESPRVPQKVFNAGFSPSSSTIKSMALWVKMILNIYMTKSSRNNAHTKDLRVAKIEYTKVRRGFTKRISRGMRKVRVRRAIRNVRRTRTLLKLIESKSVELRNMKAKVISTNDARTTMTSRMFANHSCDRKKERPCAIQRRHSSKVNASVYATFTTKKALGIGFPGKRAMYSTSAPMTGEFVQIKPAKSISTRPFDMTPRSRCRQGAAEYPTEPSSMKTAPSVSFFLGGASALLCSSATSLRRVSSSSIEHEEVDENRLLLCAARERPHAIPLGNILPLKWMGRRAVSFAWHRSAWLSTDA